MVKKILTIVSFSDETIRTYKEQIKHFFSDSIVIKEQRIDRLKPILETETDLVLIPSYSVFADVKAYLSGNIDVIVARRTVSKAGFEKVMRIAGGEKALLLDENTDMASEMVAVLYQLGARHLELAGVAPGSVRANSGRQIITLGKAREVDANTGIVNIGSSLLDISTIVDIGVKLALGHLIERQNIREGYREIVTTNYGLREIIGKTNSFESQLDILLQVAEDGVIAIDSKGTINSFNENAGKIIGVRSKEMLGANGIELLTKVPFGHVLEKRKPVKEMLINLNGYDVVVSVDPIIHSGQFYGAVAIVKKFSDTEIRQHKLREQLIGKGHRAKYTFDDIVGISRAINKSKEIAKRMAASESSILISGESGTGKELFAQAIHNASMRKGFQFVAVNCGALPESLLESELFGYEEGAFTGARKGGKPGLFELAHKGTLFLDEIGEMPPNLQMRLLRVLQEREVMRIGGDRLIHVDVRIIAATNKDLKEMVKEGRFREDLFFRINVLPLKIQPLRSRKEDILPLVEQMKKEFGHKFAFTEQAVGLLLRHNWKGNVRELRNYLEYIANLGEEEVDVKDLPFECEQDTDIETEKTAEQTLLEQLTEKTGSSIYKYIFVLESLEKAYGKSRMGRRSICLLADQTGLYLSEQEIRTILLQLEMYGLVEISKGRGGTVISESGKRMLNYYRMG